MNQWNDQAASAFAGNALELRVYSSQLLGREADLVLHGGGNTSVKTSFTDYFGRQIETLYVKGSGWDLKTIEKAGYAPIRLQETKLLADLNSLTDDDMAAQLQTFLLDPKAPAPSVEAILHAIIPFNYVDHTHADAVVTLTNTPDGESRMRELYPDCLILPYIMPGFLLAQQVHAVLKVHDLTKYNGIILLHHGLLTYSNDAREAYETMIELVTRAEKAIERYDVNLAKASPGNPLDLLTLARIRKCVSLERGKPQLAILDQSELACGFASLENVDSLATRGPITPDHVIRTKRTAAIFEPAGEPEAAVTAFAQHYHAYYRSNERPGLTMLDPAPRWAVWKKRGTLAFGANLNETTIIQDIVQHTTRAIQIGEAFGGWQALPASDLFDLEYWVLEQAKLEKGGVPKTFAGQVAIVTGAAGGIGFATAQRLAGEGAVVVGLDVDEKVRTKMDRPGFEGRVCDLCHEPSVREAVESTVLAYGGLDLVVCNAGIFKSGETIEELGETWDRTLSINLTATQRFLKETIPYLKEGLNASIIIIGSRNYAAPGAGAAAYSVSKAGVTQLGRVAALELAKAGVRVNILHPDAVFDTELWTEATLQASAARYGMTVAQYKKKNLLGTEIRADDVAAMVATMAGPVFKATTGAQIPIDGGNDRVI